MNNCLIILNIAYGYLTQYSPTFCENFGQVTENIIKNSKDFTHTFIVNDDHTINDPEFEYLPPHQIKNSGNIARIPSFEKQIKSDNLQFLTKNKR